MQTMQSSRSQRVERPSAAPRRKANARDKRLRMAAQSKAEMRPSPFFSKLPVEIRVMIYDLAYDDEGGSINVNLKPRTRAYKKGFKCAFDPLIVSKEWLNEAFDIFVRSQQFHFQDFNNLQRFTTAMPLIKKDIISVSWRQRNIFNFSRMIEHVRTSAPNLAHLQVYLGGGETMATYTDLLVGSHPSFITGVNEIRGLKSFRATFDDFAMSRPHLNTIVHRSIFEANEKEFYRQIRDVLTKAEGT